MENYQTNESFTVNEQSRQTFVTIKVELELVGEHILGWNVEYFGCWQNDRSETS